MADNALPNADYFRQRLAYNPGTGALVWKERPVGDFPNERIWKGWNSRQVGKPAFAQKAAHGYLVGRMGGVNYYAHRIIWLMEHGNWPDTVDHLNGDGWDNRLCNLRNVSHAVNLRNMKRRATNRSGVAGVSKSWGKWRVRVSGESHGSYATKGEAIAVRRNLQAVRGFTPDHGTAKMVRR